MNNKEKLIKIITQILTFALQVATIIFLIFMSLLNEIFKLIGINYKDGDKLD